MPALNITTKKNIKIFLFAIVVFIVGGVLIYPSLSSDYTSRAEIVHIINEQDDLKLRIKEVLDQGGAIGENIIQSRMLETDITVIDRNGQRDLRHIKYTREVSANGEIHLHHIMLDTDVFLIPDRANGAAIRWTCHGTKPENLPSECR